MYIPKQFTETDAGRLEALIESHGFALVVTTDAEGLPVASHLPLIYEAGRGPHGSLLGHVARANPQWRHFEDGTEVLAVFSGPHAYISPSWYEDHPAVPTWNYATVHVYGRPRIVDDAGETRGMLARLVDAHEAGFVSPWRMDLPADYEDRMVRGIVAFEIEISRLEGKFKLSQNRPAMDRVTVADQLAASGHDDATGIARLMREREGEA
ncbi:MAG: FMN-binding negative transcriptional regulator [Alphaproteobacteria bacterium]|nr:FMN-binding negative transcriptional regulator [Alphaproteobacteria bacterium]